MEARIELRQSAWNHGDDSEVCGGIGGGDLCNAVRRFRLQESSLNQDSIDVNASIIGW